MKISRKQLQKYFDQPLPEVEAISDAFMFHAFEVEGVEGDVLEVKVLPNRAKDADNEEGLARELGAILDIPLKGVAAPTEFAPAVTVSLARINGTLGTDFSHEEVVGVFKRLGFSYNETDGVYEVAAPTVRADITLPEDVAEEVGRILGYDRVVEAQLPPPAAPIDQNRYRGTERMKDQLVEAGFIEVSTQSFAKKGDVYLANPMDKTKPALRTSLAPNLEDALMRAKQYAPLVLAPGQKPKLFEVGSVFPKEGEYMELRMTETAWEGVPSHDNLTVAKLEDYGKDYTPKKYTLGAYQPFSVYPFTTRDIAMWVPADAQEDMVREMVISTVSIFAQNMSTTVNLVDRFEKEGRESYAFRLVFQATDRTLTDEEVTPVMEKISAALASAGYEIR